MKFQIEVPSPSAPGSGGSARYSIDPNGMHATLVDVAADGESLAQAAKDTRDLGEITAANFGSAEVVAAAFTGFWAGRDDVGERVASVLFRKADAVSAAAHAFVQADAGMVSSASAALSKLPAAYAPPRRAGAQAVQ